jgi:alpha-1,2-mannosyltransferase
VLGVLSVGAALGLAIALALGREADFDVYRMGAEHVRGPHLYRERLPGLLLPFTYPPFAAMLFWPFTRFSIRTGQLGWTLFNLVALAGLIGVSLRAVRPDWSNRRIWSIAVVALFPVLLLNPDVGTLGYGQVNFVIALLVLVDLTVVIRLRSHTMPRGVLVGIAAALKLTPLIFIPFLVLTRQFRAAVTAAVSFVVCTLVAFAVSPHSSWTYWSKEVLDSRRAGNLLYMSDQNLHAALARMTQATPSPAVQDSLTVLIAVGGLALAAWAYRASSPVLGILVGAATGLIISPVSWQHHYVWIVPLLGWLLLGSDRPRGGRWWALGAALLFWAAPIWWVPNRQRGYGGPLVLLVGNSFFLAAVAFLLLVGGLLWSRRRAGGGRPEGTGGSRSGVGLGLRSGSRGRQAPVGAGAVEGN